jgi:hypothetical protein
MVCARGFHFVTCGQPHFLSGSLAKSSPQVTCPGHLQGVSEQAVLAHYLLQIKDCVNGPRCRLHGTSGLKPASGAVPTSGDGVGSAMEAVVRSEGLHPSNMEAISRQGGPGRDHPPSHLSWSPPHSPLRRLPDNTGLFFLKTALWCLTALPTPVSPGHFLLDNGTFW